MRLKRANDTLQPHNVRLHSQCPLEARNSRFKLPEVSKYIDTRTVTLLRTHRAICAGNGGIMQKKFYRLLVAGVASVLVSASQSDAKIALNNTFQDHKSATCAAGNTCRVEFAAATAASSARATYIEAMSCWIKIARNSSLKPVINRVQLNQSSPNGVHIFIAPVHAMEITAADIKYQIYASGLNYTVPAGSKPQVIVDLSSNAPAGSEIICAYTARQDGGA